MGRRRASSTKRRNLEGRYAITPSAAYSDKRLNTTDIAVLGAIGTYATPDRPAFPYAIDLARTLGISERTVRRSIETLTATGYLRPTTYNGRRAWSMATASADCSDLPDELRRWTPWLDHDPKPDTRDRNKPNSGHPRPELNQNRTPETGISGPIQNRTSEIPKPDIRDSKTGHPCPESWGYGDEWGYTEKEEQEERGERTTPRPPPKDDDEAAKRIMARFPDRVVGDLMAVRMDEWPFGPWTVEAWDAECRWWYAQFPDRPMVAS